MQEEKWITYYLLWAWLWQSRMNQSDWRWHTGISFTLVNSRCNSKNGGVLHHLRHLGPGGVHNFPFQHRAVVHCLFFPARVIGNHCCWQLSKIKLKLEPFIADCVFWLNRDLGFRKIICSKWREGNKTALKLESKCYSDWNTRNSKTNGGLGLHFVYVTDGLAVPVLKQQTGRECIKSAIHSK